MAPWPPSLPLHCAYGEAAHPPAEPQRSGFNLGTHGTHTHTWVAPGACPSRAAGPCCPTASLSPQPLQPQTVPSAAFSLTLTLLESKGWLLWEWLPVLVLYQSDPGSPSPQRRAGEVTATRVGRAGQEAPDVSNLGTNLTFQGRCVHRISLLPQCLFLPQFISDVWGDTLFPSMSCSLTTVHTLVSAPATGHGSLNPNSGRALMPGDLPLPPGWLPPGISMDLLGFIQQTITQTLSLLCRFPEAGPAAAPPEPACILSQGIPHTVLSSCLMQHPSPDSPRLPLPQSSSRAFLQGSPVPWMEKGPEMRSVCWGCRDP